MDEVPIILGQGDMIASALVESDQTLIRRARCPRCGYDLRGGIATWSDSCPLNGTCAECGLAFEWAELLSPSVRKPAWCVEYAANRWAVPWRCVKTLAMTFWPWGFWKSLKMTHEPRWLRLSAFLFLLVAVCYIAFAIGSGVVGFAHSAGVKRDPSVSTTVGTPSVVLRCALLPFSRYSPGIVKGSTWSEPYWSSYEIFGGSWQLVCGGGIGFAFAQITTAFTFVILPISRRIARVRWAHIFRVAVYAVGLVVPFVVLNCVLVVTEEVAYRSSYNAPLSSAAEVGIPLVGTVLTFAHILWWSIATSRYLRMAYGLVVGLVVAVIGFAVPTLIHTATL